MPHLTRSSLHRCLQRHGISRLPEVEGDKPDKIVKYFLLLPIMRWHHRCAMSCEKNTRTLCEKYEIAFILPMVELVF